MGNTLTIGDLREKLERGVRWPTKEDADRVFRVQHVFRLLLGGYGALTALVAVLALVFGWISSTYFDPCVDPVDNVAFFCILFLVNTAVAWVLAFIDPMRMRRAFLVFLIVHLVWLVAQWAASLIYLIFEGFVNGQFAFWWVLDVLVALMMLVNIVAFVIIVLYLVYARNLVRMDPSHLYRVHCGEVDTPTADAGGSFSIEESSTDDATCPYPTAGAAATMACSTTRKE